MTDDQTPKATPVRHSMKPKDLDLEQQIADSMWTMGEGEWREMHED